MPDFHMRPCILILTAVMPEAAAVAKALRLPFPLPAKPTSVASRNGDIELHVIGIAGRGLEKVRTQASPTAVIMAGLGGALDPKLNIADVVVQGLPVGLGPPVGCISAAIHTVDQIVGTADQKAELFDRTGASAVDMENAIVARWVWRLWGAGVPILAVRSISDRADQSLDPAVLKLVDEWGRPKPLQLVRTLLLRPRLISHLLRLRADSKKAATRLGEAVREVVEQMAGQAVTRNL
jgi:hypothetical protein